MAPPSSDGQQQWRGAATGADAVAEPASQWQDQAPSRPLTPSMAGAPGAQQHRALPRPPSLVFDIELEERGDGPGSDMSGDAVSAALRRFLLPGSTGEYKLRNDVELGLAQQQHLQQPSALDRNQQLAAFLTRLGYRVHIRTALGGGEGFECLRNLRHVFLAVMPPGAHATTNRFVVDLSFKEQFRIAKPTPRYQSLLDCLPSTYVAPEAAVTPLVNFMCQEMALAFNATGVVLPPWRQTHSMLSKWIPRKSLDEQVPRPTLSPATPGVAAAPAGALHSTLAAGGPPQAPSFTSARRSMDVTTGQVVHGHWVTAGAQQQQQQQQHPQQQQQQDAGRRSVFANQQQQQQVGGIAAVLVAAVPSGAGALTHRLSSGPVKPMSCEPQRVMVGGNFSAIGFA